MHLVFDKSHEFDEGDEESNEHQALLPSYLPPEFLFIDSFITSSPRDV